MRAWLCGVVLVLLTPAAYASTGPSIGLFRVAKPTSATLSSASRLTIALTGKRSPVPSTYHLTVACAGTRLKLSTDTWTRTASTAILSSKTPILIAAAGRNGVFRGRIRLGVRGSRLLIVDEVGLEDYVRGVLANEMDSTWPTEALKAQAVVARTVAIYRAGSHGSDGFDLCDTTHCQVYRGVRSETPRTIAAVASTRDLVLTHSGKPANALYHSTCGGKTTSMLGNSTIPRAPYLQCVTDTLNGKPACADSPHFSWTSRIANAELARALSSDPRTDCGSPITSLRVASRDPSSRAKEIEARGRSVRRCDAYVWWNTACRRLGWARIKSTQFAVSKNGNAFEFRGHGLGHGIGLCQWGARSRARAGWDYRRILSFYYPGTRVQPSPGGKVRSGE